MNSGPNNTVRTIFWAGTLPAIVAACFFYYPHCFTGPVICPMPLALGIPCPGCGITRATCLMTHGHFAEALAFHPLAPFLWLYFGALWVYKILEARRGEPPRWPAERISGWALAILLGFWVARLAFFFAQGGLEVVARENLVARLARLLS
jgi:hypothetical protein